MTSNKPVSARPQKIQTLRPMSLIALYSGATILVLAYVSYKWVYSHPSQVATRMEQAIEATGAGPVFVTGATQETLSGMRAEKIEFQSADEVIAAFSGVHVADAEVECGQGGQRKKSKASVQAGGASGGLPVLVCSARLAVAGVQGDGAGSPVEWKLAGFPVAEKLHQCASGDPFELRVRELELECSVADSEGKPSWLKSVHFDNLQLSAGRDGLSGRVGVSRSAACDGGELEFSSVVAGNWKVWGGVENIREAGEWLQLLPGHWRELWRGLSPAGSFSLRIDPPGTTGFSGRIRTSAWSFRIPVVGMKPSGVAGFARLGEGDIAWGEEAGFEGAALVLLGQNGVLSGRVGAEGEGRLSVSIAEEKLTDSLPADAPRVVGNIFKALQPSASVQGKLDISVSSLAEDTGSWELALALGRLHLHGARAIVPGPVQLELKGEVGGKGRGSTAQGQLEISDMTVAGLFSLKGALGLSWVGEDLALEVSGLEIRPAGTPPAEEAKGRLLGRLQTVNGGDGIEGKVSWVGTELRSSLLRVLEMSGFAESEVGTGIVLGAGSLKDARIPAGILGDEELSYERGRADWSVDTDGLHVAVLELSGGSGAIRATGTIGFDSRVDLVCVQVGEKEAEALRALPLESKPVDWMAVEGKAYRLSGKLDEPLVLVLQPDDKVLEQAGRNDAADN